MSGPSLAPRQAHPSGRGEGAETHGLFDLIRSRGSMYSFSSAALYGVIGLLLISDIFLKDGPRLGYGLTSAAASLSLAVAVYCLLHGADVGAWPALALLTANAVSLVLDFTALNLPAHTVGQVLQMPVLALYSGIFLRPWLARTAQAAVLIAISAAALLGPAASLDLFYGGRNLLKLVFFTWLCLEAGVFAQKRFTRESHVDPLTGALNRRGLIDIADVERTRATKLGQPICVAVIDLDRFKELNDSEGHGAGDRVLLALTRQWRELLRANDAIVRLGGDEFMLMLPNTDARNGEAILQRLSERSVHPWSWGAAEWHEDELLSVAVARADAEMYKHKTDCRS